MPKIAFDHILPRWTQRRSIFYSAAQKGENII